MRAKGGSVLLLGGLVRGWTQVTGLALFALGARILGVAEFGVFALAVAFISIVQVFLYSGVYEYILRRRKEDGLDHMLLVMNLAFSLAGALASSAMGWLIARASHQPAVAWLTLAMAPSALIAGIAAWHEAQVLRANRYDIYYLVWVVAETSAAVVGAILMLSGAKLYSLVGYRYLQSSLMVLGYLLAFRVPYWGAVKLRAIPEALRFAGPIYGSRLLGALSNYGVDLVVGIVIGPTAAGLYRMSSRIVASFSEVLFQPLRIVAWVQASRAKGRNPARVVLALLPLNRLTALVLWPAAVVLSFVAADALTIGLGPSWAAASVIITALLIGRGLALSEVFLEPLLATIGAGRLLITLRILSIAAMFGALFMVAPFGAAYIGAPSIVGTLVTTAGVVAVVIRAAGARRLFASVSLAAVAALLTVLVFLAGEVAIRLENWNHVLVHAVGGVGGGLILLIGLLIQRRDLRKLRRQAPPAAA